MDSDDTIISGPEGASFDAFLAAGASIGDYVIERFLGAGAMGEVYLARQARLGQRCALKVLPESLGSSADFRRRFVSEGRALAMLDHQNIVRVLYAGEQKGRHFLAMEYVEGGNLEGLLAAHGGRLPPAQVRLILSELLAGLAYAHGKGVVHRDLKPSNILISSKGACKISDFGLALVAGEQYMQSVLRKSMIASRMGANGGSPARPTIDPEATIAYPSATEDSTIVSPSKDEKRKGPEKWSEAAALVGSLDYMSPEVRSGRQADARSDIYALGVMAYQMLTGKKPLGRFKEPSKLASGISKKWDAWVFRCMEIEPEDRFQNASQALAALPQKGGRVRSFLGSLFAGAVLAAAAYLAGKELLRHAGLEQSAVPVEATADAQSATDYIDEGLNKFIAGDYAGTVAACDEVLSGAGSPSDEDFAVALYYRGRAQREMGLLDKALEDYQSVLHMDGVSEDIRREAELAFGELQAFIAAKAADSAAENEAVQPDSQDEATGVKAEDEVPDSVSPEPQTPPAPQEEEVVEPAPEPVPEAPALGAIRLATTPDTVSVYLDGVHLGETPHISQIEDLPEGSHKLLLKKTAYAEIAREVEIIGGETLDLGSMELTALPPGGLTVKSSPAGALVRVGDTASHITPWTFTKLPAGDYQITFSLAGYESVSVAATVLPDQFVAVPPVTMRRLGGRLVINSSPAPLEWAFVETPAGEQPRQVRGETPTVIDKVPTGAYMLEIRREGWLPARHALNMQAGRTITIEQDFQSGSLSLSSNLSDVQWRVVEGPELADIDAMAGAAPARLEKLPVGEYVLEFSRASWPNVRRSVTVSPDGESSVRGEFLFGTIEIDSVPRGAEVFGPDGAVLGQTPLSLSQAAPGEYRFTLRHSGYVEGGVTGLVNAGQTARFMARLEEEKPAGAELGSDWVVPDYNIQMIWISPGRFAMGSPDFERYRENDEKQHRVMFTKGFWMGKYEVTQAQWQALMGTNPSNFASVGPNAPVDSVSWAEAMAFCRKLTEIERAAGRIPAGYEYSLPTEAQWEYAARAGSDDPYSGGSLQRIGWYAGNADGRTHPVGQKQPNAWGLYDMQGNVWEWCYDWYGEYPEHAVTEPAGPASGSKRINRGGGWMDHMSFCRVAYRGSEAPTRINSNVGFRVVLREEISGALSRGVR
ncbi:MAG: SUMF1/EgtB/PvdO family nonheme iron enzyme [Opitutales bacterium]|nr:SUMF1/EgtB/PvdO family nonheme iron enzyme [Opitutales bacterium]